MVNLLDIAKKIEEGEVRAQRLYVAVENLRPVFEEWKGIQQEQTQLLKDLSEQMGKLTAALEKHGSA